jgi:hypothetical protein
MNFDKVCKGASENTGPEGAYWHRAAANQTHWAVAQPDLKKGATEQGPKDCPAQPLPDLTQHCSNRTCDLLINSSGTKCLRQRAYGCLQTAVYRKQQGMHHACMPSMKAQQSSQGAVTPQLD